MTVGILSCDDDDNSSAMQSVVSETVLDIHAPQEGGQGAPISGEFAKFDFQSGLQTESETDWDVGFRGTTIIVNGGASMGMDGEPERTGEGGAYIFNGLMQELSLIHI